MNLQEKLNKHGNIERYEARLEAMCTVLALSVLFSYMVHQMNIYSGSHFIVEGRSIYRGTSGVYITSWKGLSSEQMCVWFE